MCVRHPQIVRENDGNISHSTPFLHPNTFVELFAYGLTSPGLLTGGSMHRPCETSTSKSYQVSRRRFRRLSICILFDLPYHPARGLPPSSERKLETCASISTRVYCCCDSRGASIFEGEGRKTAPASRESCALAILLLVVDTHPERLYG